MRSKSIGLALLTMGIGILEAVAVPGAVESPRPASIERIGAVEIPFGAHPDFDVVADEKNQIFHLVFRSGAGLYYLTKQDGSASWSEPERIGEGISPRLALDASGALHLAYAVGEAKSPTGDAIHYRRRGPNGWESATDVFGPPIPDKFKHMAPRIAVDGDGHVHIIAWKIVRDAKRWKELSRCAYRRLPQGASQFEAPQEFNYGRDGAEGGGLHGELIVDPKGDVHLLIASWLNVWRTTHFSRARDGTWSSWVHLYRGMASDFALSGAIDREGVLHVAGFIAERRIPRFWAYFNNRRDRSEMDLVHSIDEEWEIGNDLLLRPNGDLWIVRGNWQNTGNIEPLRGRLMHYSAARDAWSEPRAISPLGHRNLDLKHGQVPKFVAYKGQIKLFYAEDAPGRGFGLFVQTFDP